LKNQTIGQRIAACRKNLGLSQEALGEQLGVSRQAIYKWESDAALPEIEKLVALSKLFGISVGALLGVEEPAEASEQTPEWNGELSEQQLKMVEQIVSRYLESQPKRKVKKRWIVLGVAAALGLVIVGFNLFNRLDRLQTNYNWLNNSVNNLSSNMSSQIYSISSRVEEILQQQNSLLADYKVAVSGVDYRKNLVTFTASAVPKTYVEGLRTFFTVESAGTPSEFEGELGEGNRYSAELTCEMTDDITVSVSFLLDGVRQTQQLQTFSYLYTNSFPDYPTLSVSTLVWPDDLRVRPVEEGESGDAVVMLSEHERYVDIRKSASTSAKPLYDSGDQEPPATKSVRMGLFINNRLAQWLEPSEQPSSYIGFEDSDFYKLPQSNIYLYEGDVITFNAVFTDTYGRERVVMSYDAAILTKNADGAWVMERAGQLADVWEYE